jgi:hypothetical protein
VVGFGGMVIHIGCFHGRVEGVVVVPEAEVVREREEVEKAEGRRARLARLDPQARLVQQDQQDPRAKASRDQLAPQAPLQAQAHEVPPFTLP